MRHGIRVGRGQGFRETWLVTASTSVVLSRVFEDPLRLEVEDDRFDYGEKRFKTIGVVREIVVVVFTYRNDSIRIISARKAESYERKAYYKSLG